MTNFDLTNPDKLPFGEWPREAQEAAIISAHLDNDEWELMCHGTYWSHCGAACLNEFSVYRLKPQSHQLDIPIKLWRMFPLAKSARLLSGGSLHIKFDGENGSFVAGIVASDFGISTEGIDPCKSLTKRPEGL